MKPLSCFWVVKKRTGQLSLKCLECFKSKKRAKRPQDIGKDSTGKNIPKKATKKTAFKLFSYKARNNANGARIRAEKYNAAPSWLTEEQNLQILWFYEVAQMFQDMTGKHYAVDHISPLQGQSLDLKTFKLYASSCGLHVPWNLQVITREKNTEKGFILPT